MSKEILFEPSPTQQLLLEAVFGGQHKYILFGGAVRGGKTYAVLGATLLLCKKYPQSRWIIVRDTLQTLKRNLIPAFFKICPVSFIRNYNQDLMTVTFTNGSQVIFFGEGYEDDKELLRWRGLEASGFILEEANELQLASFYKAVERAGTWIPNGIKPPPLILLTCNPARNWVKELFYDRFVNGTLPRDWCYIPSKIQDNPHIMRDEAYLESLKNLPTYEYAVFVEGNWELQERTGGEAYKAFDINHHVGDYSYDPKAKLFISFDENVNPYLPAGIFQIKLIEEKGKTIKLACMIDEILGYHPHNTIEAVCNLIKTKYPPDKHRATVELFGDATSNKQDAKLEKGQNFFTLAMGFLSDYKITNRVSSVNEPVSMRLSWINAVMEKENANIRFRIDRRCKHTINDLMLTKEAADGSKAKTMTTDPKTKVRYQAVGHLGDLTDYFLTGVFADEYHRYKSSGRSLNISFGKNLKSKWTY